MPRVNIHEVDNTKPGTRAYQNFTVVVPGFHAPYVSRLVNETVREEIGGIVLDKEVVDPVTGVKSYPPLEDKEVFGEENILEIKTQADFEQYIGFVKPIAYNEGYKANVISREVLAEDVYGDPANILYYDGKPGEYPIDTSFVVEQNKEEDTITFIYRWDDSSIQNPYLDEKDEHGQLVPNPDYVADADKAFSTKYDKEEKVVYKYSVNGFDVSLFAKPMLPEIGTAPFNKQTANVSVTGVTSSVKVPFTLDSFVDKKTKEAKPRYCTAAGEILNLNATITIGEGEDEETVIVKNLITSTNDTYVFDQNLFDIETEVVDDETVIKSISFKDAIISKVQSPDYDLDNPIEATEAYVLLDDEQKIHEAGCQFDNCDVPGGAFKKQQFQWRTDVRLPAHYGNQIAYELLGLGYTVYYVNMGEWNPTKEAEGETVIDDRGYIVYREAEKEMIEEDGKEVPKTDSKGNFVYKKLNDADKKKNYSIDYSTGLIVDEFGYGVPELEEEAINVGLKNIDKAYKALGSEDFWAPLRDKTTYDFRFVLTGFIEEGNFTAGGYRDYMKNANFEISKLAAFEAPGEDAFAHVRARGDCLALIDLDEDNIAYHFASTAGGQGNTTKRLVAAIQKDIRRQNFGIYGKYSAIFTPSVTYANNLKQDVYQNCKFPASFHYLACFAKSVFADNYKEWFAVAGFTRGLSTYNIDSVGFNLGDVAMNALEPRFFVNGSPVNVAVNVIVNNRGSYYIWGNRTCHTLGVELTASHFLNIRQLCITLKKFIYVLCRKFTFDPNSDVLWANWVSGLTPLLENMKANQGIRDYAIEKVPTDLKGVLAAKVRIVPIEAVEDFEITVSLEDSLEGVSVSE